MLILDPKNDSKKSSGNRKKISQGFAKAFKKDIGHEKDLIDEKWEVSDGRSLLMSEVRQNIFKYLCEFPCGSLSTIAKDLKLSVATVSWHLNLMLERKLLSEIQSGGHRVFYPTNMVEGEAIPILIQLANPKIHDIYLIIRETPGISQKNLSNELGMSHQSINTYTNRLKRYELISVVRDGKFIRYYPTQKIEELSKSQRKNLKEFRKWIIKIFKYDGVNPKLIRVTDQQIFLQITSGTNVESLVLSINPFQSIFNDRARFLVEI